MNNKYSIFSLIKNAFSQHENWQKAWRDPETIWTHFEAQKTTEAKIALSLLQDTFKNDFFKRYNHWNNGPGYRSGVKIVGKYEKLVFYNEQKCEKQLSGYEKCEKAVPGAAAAHLARHRNPFAIFFAARKPFFAFFLL